MNNLSCEFKASELNELGLVVPDLALRISSTISDILGAQEYCIGGGFPRGIYMQQVLGLVPEMNDIDLFVDISVEQFEASRGQLEEQFGEAIRIHIGSFQDEADPRGLIEFILPKAAQDACAGVETVQINFGPGHIWARPEQYVSAANLGINQSAITPDGRFLASNLFISDMRNSTITMNPERVWDYYGWKRTHQSIEKYCSERAEFHGWKPVFVEPPMFQTFGVFWKNTDPSTRPDISNP